MPEAAELVRSLFDALNARDPAALEALSSEQVELLMVPTEAGGRPEPYVGHTGLRELLADTGAAWEELLFTLGDLQLRGDVVLVSGRVHTRSSALGLRDLPVAWVLRFRGGVLASGHVFSELDAAVAAADADAEGAASSA
jgi:ketosteroid isomerase-like protein